MQDECHLIWGDTCGYTWLTRNGKVSVKMDNFRKRQTYYGFVNILDKKFQLYEYEKGNGSCTVNFLEKVCANFEGKQIWMIWDGASYHKGKEVKEYLAQVNEGLEEKDWKINLIEFEKNAPDQNPVEDIWLKGKNFLRRNFYKFTSFEKVRKGFREFLNHNTFYFKKYEWYLKTTE
jgi:transposase